MGKREGLLFTSIGAGDLNKVKALTESSLFSKGVDVNIVGEDRNTPLTFASSIGRTDMVELLISRGADINAKNRYGVPPLGCALQNDHLNTAELLISRGADINAKNKDGEPPLVCALQNDHLNAAELLIFRGADVNGMDKYGDPCLTCAADKGLTEIAQMLIAKGADINIKNAVGYTPLTRALATGRIETAEKLINMGANVHLAAPLRNRENVTPLHMASENGFMEIVQLLIAKGADVDARDSFGSTPLHDAAYSGRKEIVRLLLAKGSALESVTKHGATALHWACKNGYKEIVQLLIDAGADVNAATSNGDTPLDYAIEGQDDSLFSTMKAHGVVTDEGRMDTCQIAQLLMSELEATGVTAITYLNRSLLESVRKGRTAMADLLITKGADANFKDKDGSTPLIRAIEKRNKDAVRLLIARGADISVGQNAPMMMATCKGYDEILEVLRQAGASEITDEQYRAYHHDAIDISIHTLAYDFSGKYELDQVRSDIINIGENLNVNGGLRLVKMVFEIFVTEYCPRSLDYLKDAWKGIGGW